MDPSKTNSFFPDRLTQYKPASLQEVAILTFSFVFVLFSASFMGLCDRLILARSSLEGLESGISAIWLSQLFQIPIIRAVSMAQAFIGQYKGERHLEKVGPCIWQMIWLSLFTMLVTWPLSLPVGKLFFQKTNLQDGLVCFRWLMAVNFLFPLGSALSAFYLGRGNTKRVVLTSIASHCLHILLDFPLVFGIPGLLAPLGVLGSILSAIVAQFFFCLSLFFDFIQLQNHAPFHTRQFLLKWRAFIHYVRISLPRSIAKLIQLSCWIFMTKIMLTKGADYAAVLAFGGTIFLNCLNEGLSQSLTTVGAYLIGSKQQLLTKAIQSGCIFLSLETLCLVVPLCFFPKGIITFFSHRKPRRFFNSLVYGFACSFLQKG